MPASLQFANANGILNSEDCCGRHNQISPDDAVALNHSHNTSEKRGYFLSTRVAFTLAEVLITLGIIGVVAAITIPIISNATQDAQYKTAYKKAYSVLSQAVSQANTDNALISGSGSYDLAHLVNFVTVMSYMKLQKTCLNYDGGGNVIGGNTQCWYPDAEGLHRASNNGYPQKNVDISAIDISGMSWGLCSRGFATLYAVDTNGFKGPNQMGKDRFVFMLYDATGSLNSGVPIKVSPYYDNDGSICELPNKCGTVGDPSYNTYFGTSWLYN